MRVCWRLAMGHFLLARPVVGRCRLIAALQGRHQQTSFAWISPRTVYARQLSHDLQNGSVHETHRIPLEKRRRRGAIMHQRKRRLGWRLAAVSGEEAAAPTTRYTIDDSVCPPTDPATLQTIVQKHIRTLPKYWRSKPVANHTAEAFEEALEFVLQHGKTSDDEKIKVILDGGCGTGRSSFLLGEMHPDCIVIGIDQSLARLSRNRAYNSPDEGLVSEEDETSTQQNGNVLLLRAELSDFWKCCLFSDRWRQNACIAKQYLLYPNPYPKKARTKSRFYAHPSFPLLMMLLMEGRGVVGSDELLVVRSNWKGYLEEFKSAVHVWSKHGGNFEQFQCAMDADANSFDEWAGGSHAKWEVTGPQRLSDESQPLTNFEAKYFECGEPVYELSIQETHTVE